MEQKQRFSLRKYKLGLASVLLGTIFLGGALASSEVAFAAENGEDTVQTTPDTIDQPTPAETGSQETSAEPTVENKVAETTVSVAETTASGANSQTSQVETPAAPASAPEDRAIETSSTSSTEKNLDNKTPQAADKVTVETSATLEKDKNYYEASKFDGNKVLELTDVSTTSNQNIDLTSDLDKIKALDSATIYVEFKPKEGQSGTYSLFSASSATNSRSYYAVGVTNGSTPFVGAPNQGSQLYGGELKSGSIDPKVWNSIAVSINRTNADGAGRIDVYFNGKSAFFSSRAGKFLKDFTDLTNMQLGLMNNGGRNIWGGNVDYRNFTIYNKALTAAEVAERSQIFSRDAVTPDAVDEDGRLLTARDAVFVKSQLPRGTFRIPALVKMQDGSLVAGADQRNTGQADYGDIEMTVRTSDDNGKTWGNKVTIFNPQNNPSAKSQSDQPTVIDIALADGNNGKLYAMYDLFPEGRGMGTLPSQAVAAYKEINGVRYQIITRGSEEYTIRENGKVYDAAGKETNYSVVVDAKDQNHAYQDYGDVYEGNNKVGNILFKEGNNGFQAVYTSYLMLSESSDNGKTWSAPRNISNMVRTDDMIFQGTGPGAGITLKNGEHAGRIIFPTYTTGRGNGQEHASLVYSDDQGQTWKTAEMIWPTSTNSETSIVELQNGALKAFMRTGGKVQEATSLDGGATWINQKTTDRDSIRTQISAVTTIQDGKEYVLLSTPGTSRRIDGFISVGEVQADNSIKWVKQRQIETGIYAYSSIADLGNGEFGILYEHGGRDAGYPEEIYYRKLNWKFLMEDPVISQVDVTQSALTNQADVIALSYSDGVVASEDLVFKLSNGRTLPFIGQKDGKTLLFKWDKEADQGATVVGVETGSLDSLNNYKLDPRASLPYTLEPKEGTETLPFDTYYKGDENLDYGSERVEAGKAGQKVTTTTYTLDATGKVIEKLTTVVTNPVAQAVVKGTKPTTTNQETALPTRYEADEDFAYGERNEVAGSPKVETTTTTYEVDATTGAITPMTTTTTTNPGRATVVFVGTKPTTQETEIASPVRYEAKADKDFGSANETVSGETGVSTVTTTYTVDPATGEVTATAGAPVITKPATSTVIYVGTKPTVTTESVPFSTDYVADESLDYGQSSETAGVAGTKTITTTYKLEGDEAVVDATSEQVTTAAQNRLVKIGTKPSITTQVLPFATTYEANPEAVANTKETVTAGQDGQVKTTIRYELNTETGEVTELTPEVDRKEAINELIKVGTKSDIAKEVITRKVTYQADPTAQAGQQTVETEGSDGTKVRTTAYDLDTTTGVATAKYPVETITAPVDKIVKVGTADKVETVEVDFTTTYTADPNRPANERSEQGGVKGSKVTTTKYSLNTQTGQVTPDTPTTVETKPVDKIVTVGTEATVTSEVIVRNTRYIANPDAEAGQQTVDTEGVDGATVTTVNYVLDTATGQAVAQPEVVQTTPAQDKVIKVGTKATEVTTSVPFATEYKADETLDYGETSETAGVAGENTVTTTYTVNADGTVTAHVGEPVQTKAPVTKVVKIGTKSETITTDVDFPTSYVADETLDYGKTTVRIPGVKGQATKTTTYELDGDKAVVDKTTTTQTIAPTAEVISVGTKPMTTTADVDYTTSYVADDTLDYGKTAVRTPGVKGQSTTTTTYKLDGNKAVVDNTSTTQTIASTAEVIAVGTKSTRTTADVDYTTSYVADATLDYGQITVRTPGIKGQSTTTTTYKLDGNKAIVDKTTTIQTTSPISEVIAVGNVQTETQPIAIVTRNVNDETLEAGQTRVVEEGKAGLLTTVTTYTVNPTTGALENGQAKTTETVKMVERVVAVGTKVVPVTDKGEPWEEPALPEYPVEQVPVQTIRRMEVRTETLPFTTERRENADLDKGVEREVQAGVNGSYKVVRDDVYEGDTLVKTGTEFETDRIEPVARIIEVGTKKIPTPNKPTNPIVTDVRPATPEEIKQLEDLKDQLKREMNQSNLPQDEKDRFLALIDQAVAKDQLMTQVNNRQVTVSLDNSQVQASRLVVRELQGAEAREVATTVERQLDNQTVVTSYDIHLVDQNNQVVTNNGETRAVTIAITKADDETLSVYYVNGDQLEEMPSIYQNGQLTFFTDHFSVYSIVRTAQTKGDTNPTPTQTSVDVAGPESEKTARPAQAQASRPAQATLPNTGENEREAGQLAALGAGLLSILGLSWVKRQKKDRA